MPSLPVALLFGVYLGVLTGIIPALVAWTLGFLFKYLTGVTLPGFGVVVLGVALAGVNGGLLALADPSITGSANAPTILVALLVIMMMVLYAHSKGDQLGAEMPRKLSLRTLGERTLALDLIESVGGNEVRVRVAGEVADVEGYPPLPEDLRAEIRAGEWTFPADLDLPALENRLAERLTNEYDLGDVSVAIDERGRATVAGAPPFSGLSKRVESGKRAVSVDALVPTGLARGDVVTVVTADTQVRGTVLSARSAREGSEPAESADELPTSSSETEKRLLESVRAPTTTGGDGQVTVAVGRTDAEAVLRSDRATVIVEARGTRREYALISLLRRAGKRFRRVTVRAGGDLEGETLGTAGFRDRFGVVVLAARDTGGWEFDPPGDHSLAPGTELYAVGTRDGLTELEGTIA
ncbi:TrkA-N protein [Halorhabdus tiamatea SARL4B]|uniref:TrkA-C domain membrane protein n=1 Tax=Halorhabdus tiamatea SARL4B TaxID=1033806 RepID=F7PHQ5_9EURY|nr:TrkA C-terminal domain-containing protein [Halorhabdus tiamatea]ERJ06899.1 TrkA-N protein [Halorhabdus tiamatea SARL4B]CCQ32397.1 TrkA-C domain membrane protein [Halorhabdus tiamatea SARL4B]